MNSLSIAEFKQSITNFIDSTDFPYELKRMVVNEIALEVSEKAKAELIAEINARESQEGENNE